MENNAVYQSMDKKSKYAFDMTFSFLVCGIVRKNDFPAYVRQQMAEVQTLDEYLGNAFSLSGINLKIYRMTRKYINDFLGLTGESSGHKINGNELKEMVCFLFDDKYLVTSITFYVDEHDQAVQNNVKYETMQDLPQNLRALVHMVTNAYRVNEGHENVQKEDVYFFRSCVSRLLGGVGCSKIFHPTRHGKRLEEFKEGLLYRNPTGGEDIKPLGSPFFVSFYAHVDKIDNNVDDLLFSIANGMKASERNLSNRITEGKIVRKTGNYSLYAGAVGAGLAREGKHAIEDTNKRSNLMYICYLYHNMKVSEFAMELEYMREKGTAFNGLLMHRGSAADNGPSLRDFYDQAPAWFRRMRAEEDYFSSLGGIAEYYFINMYDEVAAADHFSNKIHKLNTRYLESLHQLKERKERKGVLALSIIAIATIVSTAKDFTEFIIEIVNGLRYPETTEMMISNRWTFILGSIFLLVSIVVIFLAIFRNAYSKLDEYKDDEDWFA